MGSPREKRVLAQLHKQELITDDDVAQILSQDHTGLIAKKIDRFFASIS
jgi:hypothetical protein